MEVLLVAGGSPENWPDLSQQSFDRYVGIDRGALYLLEKGYSLDLAIGDFDSLSSSEYQRVSAKAVEVQQAPAEKDDTDTQLGLVKTFEHFPEASVTLIGATGGRLDHLLANLWLALEPRFQPFIRQIQIQDKQNVITYYLPGAYEIKKIPEMKYLAYCCLTPVSQLTLSDSKYQLSNEEVSRPTSYASNEFVTDKASFSFSEGIISVIQSKD
ncbi:thiamine diphosphokinase [Enterococcus mundtii]|uniref:thiamine diphosphokinase n=1 Tax=Enterococcus TaxID=1350 RepID=UPI000451F777|nr:MULTISPECIES: thiamine diphosphokinase [Enterococcus]AZP93823.1 thiamine diphosphokinase [Enterococcus mundtii]EYT95884.1 thiamine pyrophosphokinase [Enterococcus mundtii CRL35]MDA9429210.1 thiamine pyrophosphokinase [Enterococcus mundtii 1A]MDK4212114.1 thiamine diphosphokinase [Enterococcus mundtii]MDO7880034.1 thiamine diphosphokinase [Enterococcus mundtii]